MVNFVNLNATLEVLWNVFGCRGFTVMIFYSVIFWRGGCIIDFHLRDGHAQLKTFLARLGDIPDLLVSINEV